MARTNTIQLLRGVIANIDTLSDGEPYYAHDTKVLYVGYGSVNTPINLDVTLRARLTADATKTDTTFLDLSDLTLNLDAGGMYVGRLVVKCNQSVAAEGIKFDFNGGSATMTSFWAGLGVLASGGTDTLGANTATALSGVLNYTVLTGETVLVIELSMVVNAGGTFIPRFAENSTATGTATVELGSYLALVASPN